MQNDLIKTAFDFAWQKHKEQLRKGSKIPYMAHIYDVARILANNHAEEHVIVAGILHDTLEDTATTPQEIEQLFGEQVLEIVLEETENKALPWRERKHERIEHLKTASKECKMVKCADLLANLSDIYQNVKSRGESAWSVFKAGKEDIKWYYQSMIEAIDCLQGMDMYEALKKVFLKVFFSPQNTAQNTAAN